MYLWKNLRQNVIKGKTRPFMRKNTLYFDLSLRNDYIMEENN